MLIQSPGFYPDITCEQYFAEPCPAPALSASGIKTLLNRTPADFAFEHPALNPDTESGKSSAAKRMGDIVHQLVLGKGRGYAIGDFNDWRTNASKEFRAQSEAEGKTPILRDAFKEAQLIADNIRGRVFGDMGRMFGVPIDFATETVFAWQENMPGGPVWLRGMMDMWLPHEAIIFDLKITTQMYDGSIESHAANMGWDIQAALYKRGIETLMPNSAGRVRFINLLCSPEPPYLWRMVEIDEAWLHSASSEINRALAIFARCLRDKSWPGFAPAITPISAKSWLIAQRAEREAMEFEYGA